MNKTNHLKKNITKLLDLTGQRFGRLTTIKIHARVNKKILWECRCDCGQTCFVQRCHLRAGRTQSCGCLNKEIAGQRWRIHGKGETPEYNIWCLMKARCYNPNSTSFKNYGGRGIKVCGRWLASFENFLADMGKRPSPTHSIERKKNNGNYEPDNCKWALPIEQGGNKRTNRLLTYNGKTQILSAWAREVGLSAAIISLRLNRLKWSVEKALTQKSRKNPKNNKKQFEKLDVAKTLDFVTVIEKVSAVVSKSL